MGMRADGCGAILSVIPLHPETLMNLLLHLTPSDYDGWKAAFDADYEARMSAGLTLFQLWRDVDGPGVTALFDVNDRDRAQGWLDQERATGHPIDARFMTTA